MVELLGTVCPAGKSGTSPALGDWVTVRLMETAFAVDGTLHCPPTARTRVSWPCRAGPPMGAPPRVSTTRQGATVKKSTPGDRKSTRLNSSHSQISYAVFCLKKKNKTL